LVSAAALAGILGAADEPAGAAPQARGAGHIVRGCARRICGTMHERG
jgi:hypothetical protein